MANLHGVPPDFAVQSRIDKAGYTKLDLVLYYADWSGGWQLTYAVLLTVSAALIAGVGSWLLVRALARTGVLSPFASGADQARV